MEAIIIYKASDGRRFDVEADCITHENIVGKLTELFQRFPALPKDDGCEFTNGGGYIQHTRDIYEKVTADFYGLACQYHKGLEQYPCNSYAFWRTLDDSGSPFYGYGHRLLNINEKTFREYGQGYYRANPEKCKGGQIN